MRAAVNLAQSYPEIKSLKDISVEEGISVKYLEQLISHLRKSEILKSFKGKDGGYVLVKNPGEISAGEIIESLEGELRPKCHGTQCAHMQNCPSSFVWIKLGDQIKKTLYGIKLSDLIKK